MIDASNRGDEDELNEIWTEAVDRELENESPPAKAYYAISHIAFTGQHSGGTQRSEPNQMEMEDE
jgi:hypothetical protein